MLVGFYSLFYNTTDNNIGLGYKTLYNTTNGTNNCAFGIYSLFNNINGDNNCAIGYQALNNNINGNDNIAIGFKSLFNTTNDSNIGLGFKSLTNNTIGRTNIGIGLNSLTNNIAGSNNIAIGSNAMNNTTDTDNNISIGNCSGLYINGSDNVYIGHFAGTMAYASNYNRVVCIGARSQPTGDNQIILGTMEEEVFGGNYNSISDRRDKTDITDTKYDLEFIKSLRPVDFKYKLRNSNIENDTIHHGFIAQEVNPSFGGLKTNTNTDHNFLTLSYVEFIAPIVKSIQQIEEKIQQMDQRIINIEHKINRIYL